MRKKLEPLQPSYKHAPGPGNCIFCYHADNSLSALSPSGKYTLSQMKNCSAPKIKQMKDYDESLHRKTPGPGAYNR